VLIIDGGLLGLALLAGFIGSLSGLGGGVVHWSFLPVAMFLSLSPLPLLSV
jgi:hypothetical protein